MRVRVCGCGGAGGGGVACVRIVCADLFVWWVGVLAWKGRRGAGAGGGRADPVQEARLTIDNARQKKRHVTLAGRVRLPGWGKAHDLCRYEAG